jgi:hypothetical protein
MAGKIGHLSRERTFEMFIEVDAEITKQVFSDKNKIYTVKIPTTVECWASERVEECHGFHTFFDIDDISYDNAVQEAEEAFDDLEYATEYVEGILAEGESIIGFVTDSGQEWDVLWSSHMLHD